MQQWGTDRKPVARRFQKYNFKTVINSSFCSKWPWSSINHKVRNRKMLGFTSFSITQLEKLIFYVQRLSFYATMRHRQKAYWPYIPKIQFSDRDKSNFCCKGPWSSINHKVRNRKMLAFTSFSITQLEKLTILFKDCLFMQQWGIDRKPIDRRFQTYNF
jgi:hypothetical protein